MNYQNKIQGLYQEAKQEINFSYLPTVLKILTILILLPVIISAFCVYASFVVINFFYKLATEPCEYLEIWIEKKRENVHWLSQAVIFWVTIPFVFSLRILISVYSIFNELIWLILLSLTYIATLGGVRWQPYIIESHYEAKYTWKLQKNENFVRIYSIIPIVFTVLTIIFYIVTLICFSEFESSIGTTNYRTALEVYEIMSTIHTVFASVTATFIFIINPIIFKKTDIHSIDESSSEAK